MIVLIPMGGLGTRFRDAGYLINKPSIPTFDRNTGKTVKMIIAAMNDIPKINDPETKIICINRDFHAVDGTEAAILEQFPQTIFVHDHVLLDQAFACLLAREFLMSDDELFIGVCDSGMVLNLDDFSEKKRRYDVLMISHRGDENISKNPNAHSWAELNENSEELKLLSIKQPISENYMVDHATTGMFWFKHARSFIDLLETMLSADGAIRKKQVVDNVINYAIAEGMKVSFIDVKYICWGTPIDFEEYQATCDYWKNYVKSNEWL